MKTLLDDETDLDETNESDEVLARRRLETSPLKLYLADKDPKQQVEVKTDA